ncbi:RNA-directed DNA polymerase from mobile element jockey [Trichonephila clavipes]|nr:RNA-directed DNA polymerase from mobile element jockey [Trichonephila clavipes]
MGTPSPSLSDDRTMDYSSSDTEEENMETLLASKMNRSPSPPADPPSIKALEGEFQSIENSLSCTDFIIELNSLLDDLDSFRFDSPASKDDYQNGCRKLSVTPQTHDAARSAEIEKEVMLLSESQAGLTISLPRASLSRPYDSLPVEDPPIDEENEDEDPAPHTPKYRKPPPITIDNVANSAALLKKLQALTRGFHGARVLGRGLRVYPNTPQAYHGIRKYIDREKLESFTYQLNEEKELKAVIRGMPSDMPPQQIIEAVRISASRSTTVENEANRDVYLQHHGGLFHENNSGASPSPGMALHSASAVGGSFIVPASAPAIPNASSAGNRISPEIAEDPDTDATCCHCQGNHPANFSGCPMNPLNKPPPPPKSFKPPAQPTETRTSPQLQTPPTPAPAAQPPQDSSLLGTLKELQDPQVVELLTTMKKIVAIAKQDKTQGEKAIELCHLLGIKI